MRSWTLLLVAAISWLLAAPLLADDGGSAAGPEPVSQTSPMLDAAAAPLEQPVSSAAVPTGLAAPTEPAAPTELATPSELADPTELAAAEEDGGEIAVEPPTQIPDAPEISWESFDDPGFDPADPTPVASTPVARVGTERAVALGPMAVDAEGRRGRIHTVVDGDTLWDISQTYLGTPWVWPSVWQDNVEIENPHRIRPGDHVWVTAGEIRIVSEKEADRMIAAESELQVASAEPPPVADTPEPVSVDEEELMEDWGPSVLDALPAAIPLEGQRSTDTGRSVRVSEREEMGFVSSQAIDAATSIVGSPSPRTYLVDGDMLYLGLGEGRVEVGDQFTVFRDADAVIDVENGSLLGYHVDILGWAEVREVQGETATAEVRMSRSEITRGDRVIPRDPVQLEVPLKATPDGIGGRIVYMPEDRTRMADGDYVYVNRGSLHGFEIGSEVEVYSAGRLRRETVSGGEVMTPDHVVAWMVLVEVRPDSSVAFVVQSSRELEVGDRVRPAGQKLASR